MGDIETSWLRKIIKELFMIAVRRSLFARDRLPARAPRENHAAGAAAASSAAAVIGGRAARNRWHRKLAA